MIQHPTEPFPSAHTRRTISCRWNTIRVNFRITSSFYMFWTKLNSCQLARTMPLISTSQRTFRGFSSSITNLWVTSSTITPRKRRLSGNTVTLLPRPPQSKIYRTWRLISAHRVLTSAQRMRTCPPLSPWIPCRFFIGLLRMILPHTRTWSAFL